MNLQSLSASFRALMRTVLWLLPILGAVQLQAQDTETEFWPEFDVYFKLNESSRLFFLYSATRLVDQQSYAEGSLGAYFDFYTFRLLRRPLLHADAARSKLLMIRAGYLFSRSPSGTTDPFVEHTPTLEAVARVPLPWELLLSDRHRVDFRFVDGDFRPRYRNRLKLERTFKVVRVELTPYGHAEVFYDWTSDKFTRFRYAAGVEASLWRHMVLEIYYLRQEDTVSSTKYVNALGAALQFYFP